MANNRAASEWLSNLLGRMARAAAGGVIDQAFELFSLLRGSRLRRALATLSALMVLVIILNAAAQVRLNSWQGNIYDAIGQRDTSVFIRELLVFAVIMSVLLVLNVSQTWLHEMLKIRLREAVSVDVLDEWLRPRRAYLLPLAGEIGSFPDQRIQDDARRLTELTTDLGVGLVQSSLLLLTFVGVLWGLSAQVVFVLDGTRFTIPGYLVWCALAYALIGSWFVWLVGRPLVPANAELRAQEAEFRFLLTRVNESAEAIAIHRGEADERYHLGEALGRVLGVARRIANKLANLNWITSTYGWIGLIAPIVLAAPGYFSGSLSLGGLMMVVGAFYQVQQALRWYVDRFPSLAEWDAVLTRVMSYRKALMDPAFLERGHEHIAYGERTDEKLSLDSLHVSGPAGVITLSEAHLEVGPGERVLLAGTPKCGKTTFFRAVAGLWPWGTGAVRLPGGKRVMFLPHQPYIPLGSLREALTYPSPPGDFSETALEAVLQRVRLERLTPFLDSIKRWDKELSIDQQQRLAIGRAVLHKPEWIIHDDAISDLDEDNRMLIKSLFDRELAGTALIGIGKPTDNGGFYSRILHLRAAPAGMEPASSSQQPLQKTTSDQWVSTTPASRRKFRIR